MIEYWDNKEENGKKYEAYYDHIGNFHKVGGPAYQEWYRNGQKKWEWYFINGRPHRKDEPSCVEWSENGQRGSFAFHINGKRIQPEWFTQLGKDIHTDFTNEAILNMILNVHGVG